MDSAGIKNPELIGMNNFTPPFSKNLVVHIFVCLIPLYRATVPLWIDSRMAVAMTVEKIWQLQQAMRQHGAVPRPIRAHQRLWDQWGISSAVGTCVMLALPRLHVAFISSGYPTPFLPPPLFLFSAPCFPLVLVLSLGLSLALSLALFCYFSPPFARSFPPTHSVCR